MPKKKHGICKLTGRPGFFVNSHILPLSLTRLTSNGDKIVEAELSSPTRLRFHGWYDNELVTRAGEDILAEIDSAAVRILRANSLVWSGFDETPSDFVSESGGHGFRFLELGDAKELRLFFLSLLWRAAASGRPEFAGVQLAPAFLQDLRNRLLSKEPGQRVDFPIQLFQLVSKGLRHNRSPLLEEKHVLNPDGTTDGSVEYVRFYLDGLVAHVHIALDCSFSPEYLATCLGNAPHSVVFAHTFDNSRTYDNLQRLAKSNDAI